MPLQGFGKGRRVRRREEFQRAFDNSVRVSSRFFTLLAAPTSGDAVRLGIVASRKLGDAVRRNRAKRLIREVFRLNQPLTGRVAIDLIVIPRRELFDAHFSAIDEDFRSGWLKVVARISRKRDR